MASLDTLAMPARLMGEHSVGMLRIHKRRARQVEQRREVNEMLEEVSREEETAAPVERK